MEQIHKKPSLNWLVTSVLVFYPMFIIAGVIWYCLHYGSGWQEWSLVIAAHYIINISIGVGLHRLWSHGAYKTNQVVEFILMIISTTALQGPVIAWSSDHAFHHTYTDEELDPHSPLKFKSRLKGFWWSHIGWMMYSDPVRKHIDRGTIKRLGKSKALVFQMRHYWALAIIMNIVVPFVIGYLLGGTWQSALAGYFFIGLGRAFQQNMTFCVNSACHFLGKQTYVNGTSGDIPWLFFLLLGENWHNFHHAFARDYRNGWKWNQIDIHKWVIYLMSKVGLAWDLVITPEERIKAKEAETKLQFENIVRSRLSSAENMVDGILGMAREKMQGIEKGASDIADQFSGKILKLEQKADKLLASIRNAMSECVIQQEKLFLSFAKKIAKLEKMAASLGLVEDIHQLKS